MYKKQLVDFINSRIEKAFYEYVQKDNESKRSVASVKAENKACEKHIYKDAEKDLRELVDKLVEDPNSLLEIMNFKAFVENLPYGSVSDKVLKEMVDKLMEVNLGMAMVLFKYQVKQAGRGE